MKRFYQIIIFFKGGRDPERIGHSTPEGARHLKEKHEARPEVRYVEVTEVVRP